MTKEEYRKYLTERITETDKVIIALSDAQDAGYTGRDTGILALLLASQLDQLKHDLYYLDREGGESNG